MAVYRPTSSRGYYVLLSVSASFQIASVLVAVAIFALIGVERARYVDYYRTVKQPPSGIWRTTVFMALCGVSALVPPVAYFCMYYVYPYFTAEREFVATETMSGPLPGPGTRACARAGGGVSPEGGFPGGVRAPADPVGSPPQEGALPAASRRGSCLRVGDAAVSSPALEGAEALAPLRAGAAPSTTASTDLVGTAGCRLPAEGGSAIPIPTAIETEVGEVAGSEGRLDCTSEATAPAAPTQTRLWMFFRSLAPAVPRSAPRHESERVMAAESDAAPPLQHRRCSEAPTSAQNPLCHCGRHGVAGEYHGVEGNLHEMHEYCPMKPADGKCLSASSTDETVVDGAGTHPVCQTSSSAAQPTSASELPPTVEGEDGPAVGCAGCVERAAEVPESRRCVGGGDLVPPATPPAAAAANTPRAHSVSPRVRPQQAAPLRSVALSRVLLDGHAMRILNANYFILSVAALMLAFFFGLFGSLATSFSRLTVSTTMEEGWSMLFYTTDEPYHYRAPAASRGKVPARAPVLSSWPTDTWLTSIAEQMEGLREGWAGPPPAGAPAESGVVASMEDDSVGADGGSGGRLGFPTPSPPAWSTLQTVSTYRPRGLGKSAPSSEYHLDDDVNEQLCKLQVHGHCSGGSHLCNESSYNSSEEAFRSFCPYCPGEQATIARYTTLCTSHYALPDSYTHAHCSLAIVAVFLALSNIIIAAVGCTRGVIPSLSYEEHRVLAYVYRGQGRTKRPRTMWADPMWLPHPELDAAPPAGGGEEAAPTRAMGDCSCVSSLPLTVSVAGDGGCELTAPPISSGGRLPAAAAEPLARPARGRHLPVCPAALSAGSPSASTSSRVWEGGEVGAMPPSRAGPISRPQALPPLLCAPGQRLSVSGGSVGERWLSARRSSVHQGGSLSDGSVGEVGRTLSTPPMGPTSLGRQVSGGGRTSKRVSLQLPEGEVGGHGTDTTG